MAKKILFIDWHVETNTFSPHPTKMEDFNNFFYAKKEEDILRFSKKYKGQYLGVKKAIQTKGKGEFEVVPVYSAWGIPNGPVLRDTYDHFYEQARSAIRNHPDLAGVYLSLHGASMVEGIQDCESHFMQMVRDEIGPERPIGVSFDLHANVTPKNVSLATFIIGYKTNPHRDRHKIGFKTMVMLMDTIRGKIRPVTVIRKMRMLFGCGSATDILAPMRKFFWWHRLKWERQKGILDTSLFMVHFWMDTPDLGWSTLVTVDGEENKKKGEVIAEEMADYCWENRNHKIPPLVSVDHAIEGTKRMKWRRKTGPIFFCDMCDAIPAGAPGENTDILKALMTTAQELTSYIPVKDLEIHDQLIDLDIGNEVSIDVGGKTDIRFNTPATFSGTIVFKKKCDYYSAIVLKNRGIHLIITDNGFPGFFPFQYQELGLKLLQADIVVTKNFFPFRIFHAMYIRKVYNVITSGVTNINVHEIEYTQIPRPIYPLDDIAHWKW